jgi:hypothetical protein
VGCDVEVPLGAERIRPSPAEAGFGLHIVKSVHGVRAVADELIVNPRDRSVDDEIRGAALQALMSKPDVPADMIDVRDADGWLTWAGRSSTNPTATRRSRRSQDFPACAASRTGSRSSPRAATDRTASREQE